MTPPKDPTGKVITEILAGRHDGKLKEIVEAITARVQTDETGFLWRITLDGETWDAETVTLGELRRAEPMAGKSYLMLDPLKFMRDFSALVVAHYMHKGMTQDVAFEKADAIPRSVLASAVDFYEGTLGKGSASTGS